MIERAHWRRYAMRAYHQREYLFRERLDAPDPHTDTELLQWDIPITDKEQVHGGGMIFLTVVSAVKLSKLTERHRDGDEQAQCFENPHVSPFKRDVEVCVHY